MIKVRIMTGTLSSDDNAVGHVLGTITKQTSKYSINHQKRRLIR